jgi:hypothetical protein
MDPLITPEELSGYLQKEIDRYSAELAVRGASGVIRGICGWNLTRATETLTADCTGGVVIKLPTLRVNDVTAVRLDGNPVDPDDCSWTTAGVLIARTCWPTGLHHVTADVDHGYDPIPDDVRIVGCAIASRMYSNPEGLFSRTAGESTRTFGKTVSDLEMRLISRYALS